MKVELGELQSDALGELFNIGVGRAASALSQIVRQEVELSAPVVVLLSADEARERLLAGQMNKLSAVSQTFTGPFDARAMLLFTEKNALTIVGCMFGENMTPEELSEYEQEAMCEVGNIILNACLSALADEFDAEFDGGLPEYQFADSATLELFPEEYVLLMQIDLTISQSQVRGSLMFLLGVDSLLRLLECIDHYLARQGLL